MKTIAAILIAFIALGATAVVRHGPAGAGGALARAFVAHKLNECMDESKGYITGQGIFCIGGITFVALIEAALSTPDLNDPPHRPTLPLRS